MSVEKLNEELKTRVPRSQKKALREIAAGRHLTLADITREAVREYIARNQAAEKAVAA